MLEQHATHPQEESSHGQVADAEEQFPPGPLFFDAYLRVSSYSLSPCWNQLRDHVSEKGEG